MRLTFNACTNTDALNAADVRAVARSLAAWLGDTVTVGPSFSDESIFIVERSHLNPITPGTTYGDVMLSALDFDFLCAAAEVGIVFEHVEIRVNGVLAWDSSTAAARALA